nr:hypothetical protein CFP56_01369 [Quercus suber]
MTHTAFGAAFYCRPVQDRLSAALGAEKGAIGSFDHWPACVRHIHERSSQQCLKSHDAPIAICWIVALIGCPQMLSMKIDVSPLSAVSTVNG